MFVRKCLILVCVSLLAAVPVVADDLFGSRLVVETPPEIEFEICPAVMYLDEFELIEEKLINDSYRWLSLGGGISDVIWSPDGETNAIMASDWAMCTAPAIGGYASAVPINTYIPHEEFLVRLPLRYLVCFSPDGSEIYVCHYYKDENSEIRAEIEIDGDRRTEHGGIKNGGYCVSAVDAVTGEIATVLEDCWWVCFSSSGKYMAQLGEDIDIVIDTQTGVEYEHPYLPSRCVFSSDETSILYADRQNDTIMRVPVDGSSEPEVFAEIPGDIYLSGIGVTPDGKWIICTIDLGPREEDTWSTKYFRNVQAYNVESGELIPVVPTDTPVHSDFLSLSPDGTEIAYYYQDQDEHIYSVYTKKLAEAINENTTTAVAESAPESFAIHGAYPNPFNPATTIAFSLPERQQVELAVYNLAGQKIRTLADGVYTGGRHEIVWNGRDDSGVPAASGVYFARLTNGSHSVVQRMTLMK